MAWLGVSDHREKRFSLRGVGHDRRQDRRCPDGPKHLLARGSILFETRLSPDGRPQELLGFSREWPDQCSLRFQAIPGGGISMVQAKREHIAHAAVQHSISARTDVLRVTLAWDCLRNWARLTVERPEEHQITTVPIEGLRPMALKDLRDMVMGRSGLPIAKDVVFVAISDEVEPVGLAPSLCPETMIATPWGFRRADSLKRGDAVIAHGGEVVPVLHRVTRTVPARGSFAPIRLRAPYFGLLEDVVVAPEQRLLIDGSEVEYLFNQEAVLVPAQHLVNGFAALRQPAGPTVTYTQLVLPRHEAIVAFGAPLESLYVGRIRRNKGNLDDTLLKNVDRKTLPEHGRSSFKVLKWFEAIHFARQRAA